VKKKQLKVSVTVLADFSCRTGNLELTGNVGPSARDGIKAHQKLQKQRAAESEVSLGASLEILGTKLSLTGRVDMIDAPNNRISEIKTTMVPANKLSSSQLELQWAQLKLYNPRVSQSR